MKAPKIPGWLTHVANAIGGGGLFVVAFLDSSVLSFPFVTDLLFIEFVMQHHARMLYYALMAAAGSLAGCIWLYLLAKKGGAAYRKRHGNKGPGRIQGFGAPARVLERVPAVHFAAADAVQGVCDCRGSGASADTDVFAGSVGRADAEIRSGRLVRGEIWRGGGRGDVPQQDDNDHCPSGDDWCDLCAGAVAAEAGKRERHWLVAARAPAPCFKENFRHRNRLNFVINAYPPLKMSAKTATKKA